MSTSCPALIFGATGRVGGEVVRQLPHHPANQQQGQGQLQLQLQAVAAVRNLDKAKQQLGESVQLVQADLADPASVRAAVHESGADRAFLYVHWASKDHMQGTVQALVNSGVKHIVLLRSCTVGMQQLPQDNMIRAVHEQVEEVIRTVQPPLTSAVFLRGGAFASNTINYWGTMLKSGTIYTATPEFAASHVSEEDLAAAAVYSLLDPKPGVHVVDVHGVQPIKADATVQVISQVIGQPLKHQYISDEQYIQNMAGHSPPALAPSVLAFQELCCPEQTTSESEFQAFTNLQRAPMTLEEYVNKHKQEYLH